MSYFHDSKVKKRLSNHMLVCLLSAAVGLGCKRFMALSVVLTNWRCRVHFGGGLVVDGLTQILFSSECLRKQDSLRNQNKLASMVMIHVMPHNGLKAVLWT